MTSISFNLAGEDDPNLAQRRAYRRRVLKPQHRSISRLVRANAKHLVESGQIHIFSDCGQDHSQLDKASLRPHIQQDLRNHYYSFGKAEHNDHTPRKLDIQDDGRDLAYSDIELPSDRYRLVRRPTLEREDAFRDESTAKGKIHVRRHPAPETDDQQVADLYRMGLLYDNEQDRCSDNLTLNSIKHDEPLYSIRPAKRARKHTKAGRGFHRPLHLDLSFSDLGDDEVLAQYLIAMTSPDADSNTQETIQHLSRESADGQPPLRVIYELASSQPSFDMDTSQPPDLVTDLLSDYDYFSDGEVDDTPSQREMQEDANNPPSDAWVMLD
ncbi:hypothetical protein QQS21_000530 [Conoideocrella luteorostrata]|uniref:Uncharacterized protein n=1 Tax=Conoideocrella luteorostrata TaxID=1105319 RepID=A0AAJ0CYU4_9HYPO|nr:hypothetical protein QQS21_000530 [Conoideocrella luteorostrata]